MRDTEHIWKTLAVAVLLLIAWAVSGCRGPQAAERVLSTFTVAYTDGSGSTSGTHGGVLDNAYGADSSYSGGGSSDTDYSAWTFSIQPLVAMHDPHERTRESLDAMLADMRARDDSERAARLPFVESAPVTGVVTTEATPASGGSAGSVTAPASPVAGAVETRSTNPGQSDAPATDLPWWKDAAILTMWAGIIAALVGGIVKFWPRSKKE